LYEEDVSQISIGVERVWCPPTCHESDRTT